MNVRYRKPPPKQRSAPPASPHYDSLVQVRADTLDEVIPEEADGWALIAEYDNPGSASNLAWRLRSGRSRTPPGQWEFMVRTADGTTGVYARYRFGRKADLDENG